MCRCNTAGMKKWICKFTTIANWINCRENLNCQEIAQLEIDTVSHCH